MAMISKALSMKNWFFGRPFPIYMFARYYDIDKPIVGGNWNPKDFISEANWDWVLECLSVVPNDHYYVIIGKSRKQDKNNVNLGELIEELGASLSYSHSSLESENPERYYSTSGDCFVTVSGDNDAPVQSWVVIAKESVFKALGLTPDPALDYLKVQSGSFCLSGKTI